MIRKYALENAVKHGGKAQPGNIVGKLIQEDTSMKTRMKELMPQIQEIVTEVNQLSEKEQREELQRVAPELLEKKKEERPALKPLKNAVQGSVVMRFEPSPSGALHVGHTYPLLLNYLYCKEYDGKLILRISDTNPENIDPSAYELIQQNVAWLCPDVKIETVIQSDRMEIYYKYALQLLEEGHAYVCTCAAETFRESAQKKVACPCRDIGKNENITRWKKMGTEYDMGDAVVRIKTDITHPNPAMRDFPVLRINTTEHPRQGKKYRIWPLLNFAVAIDDHDLGLTHVLRGKDHLDNTKRQKYIFDYLKWDHPEYIHIGRINFEGLKLSTSETRKEIEKCTYIGWDDIRLPFLPALKKRGYLPEAFHKWVQEIGATMNDKTVQANEFFKTIHFHNRQAIEAHAYRYFFVENPKEITIKNAPTLNIELGLHPDHNKGGRLFTTTDTFYIAEKDVDTVKEGEMVRLMDCLNWKQEKDKTYFVSTNYEEFKKEGTHIMHWLPKEGNVSVEVQMNDGSVKIGLGEETMKQITPGTIVQLERMFFATLDVIENNTYRFFFLHP